MINKQYIKVKNLIEQMKHDNLYPNLKDINIDIINDIYNKGFITNNDYDRLVKVLKTLGYKNDINKPSILNEEKVLSTNRGLTIKFYNTIKDDIDAVIGFLEENHSYIDRSKVENNHNYLQWVVYMPLKIKDDYYILENVKYSGSLNTSTKGKYDFPAGHANTLDLRENVYRELNEELDIDKNHINSIEFKGLISISNNLSTQSYYHIGAIMEVTIKDEYTKDILKNNEPEKHRIKKLSDLDDYDLFHNCDNWFVETLCKIFNK